MNIFVSAYVLSFEIIVPHEFRKINWIPTKGSRFSCKNRDGVIHIGVDIDVVSIRGKAGLFTRQVFHLHYLFFFQLLQVPEIIVSDQISAC